MRLINPNDMVRALRANKVPLWEVLLYGSVYVGTWIALILSFFFTFGIENTQYTRPSLGVLDAVLSLILLLVEIGVTYYINKQGDNKNFLQRYIALNASLLLPSLIIAVVFNPFLTQPFTESWQVVFSNMVCVIFTVWIIKLFRLVSRKTE